MTDNENTSPDKPEEEKSAEKKPVLEKKAVVGKTPEKKQGAPNWSLRILMIVLVFVGGAVVGIYFLPNLKGRLPIIAKWTGDTQSVALVEINRKLTSQQIEIDVLNTASAALEARLGQPTGNVDENALRELEAKLTTLENAVNSRTNNTNSTVLPSVDSSQSTRIDMLLSRMSQLEASFVPLSKSMVDAARAEKERQSILADNASLSSKISALESRLLSVEEIAQKDNSGILLNYKVAELKRKVLDGLPYNIELETVNTLTVNRSASFNAALTTLSSNAATGIPTTNEIKNKFNNMIPNILSVEGLSEDASWWQKTLNTLRNMITIRKTDGSSNSTAGLEAQIAEIEEWLETSNPGLALDRVNKLPIAIQMVLNDWKADAKTRVENEAAINTLESLAVERFLTSSENETVL